MPASMQTLAMPEKGAARWKRPIKVVKHKLMRHASLTEKFEICYQRWKNYWQQREHYHHSKVELVTEIDQHISHVVADEQDLHGSEKC